MVYGRSPGRGPQPQSVPRRLRQSKAASGGRLKSGRLVNGLLAAYGRGLRNICTIVPLSARPWPDRALSAGRSHGLLVVQSRVTRHGDQLPDKCDSHVVRMGLLRCWPVLPMKG
jgi:hypothetical protein